MYYQRHTKAVDELYNRLNGLLADKVFENREVIMFGTSNIASIIIYYLGIKGVKVSAIVDNDSSRTGKVVYGVKVHNPEAYLSDYRENAVILIASTYQNEMLSQLENMGYKKDSQVYLAIDLPKVMSDYSFVDRTGYRELTIAEVKKSQLGILQKLHNVCCENNLRYYICGGTLIGAVRHKGYIPWDDDVDVVMPIKDIIKLSEILKNDKDFSFISFADDLEYFDICSLMVDNSTICDFNGFMQLSSGVSIDVFPFTGVPDGEKELSVYLETMRNLDMDKWNKLYDIKECKNALKKQVDYMLSFDYDSHNTIGNVLGRYFVKDIFPRAYFDETVPMEFEGLELTAPKEWHNYLTKLYGDYMQLPPKEKQVAVHYYKAYEKTAGTEC